MSTKPKLLKATIKVEVLFVSDGNPDEEAPHYLVSETWKILEHGFNVRRHKTFQISS